LDELKDIRSNKKEHLLFFLIVKSRNKKRDYLCWSLNANLVHPKNIEPRLTLARRL